MKNSDMQIPEDNQILWRYMDLYKFIDLIERRKLYFTPIEKFKDQYEGKVINFRQGFYESLYKKDGFQKNYIHSMKRLKEKFNSEGKNFDDAMNKFYDVIDECINDVKNTFDDIRKRVSVNCWRMDNNESLVMWNMYANSYGIAIKTTYKKLINSFTNNNIRIQSGIVEYKELPNMFTGIENYLIKRKEFEFEKEFRVITINYNYPKSLYISLDLNELIEDIHISPDAPPFFYDTIEILLKNHGLDNKKIIHQKYYNYIDKE